MKILASGTTRTHREVLDEWKAEKPYRDWEVKPGLSWPFLCLIISKQVTLDYRWGASEDEAIKMMADHLRDQEHGA